MKKKFQSITNNIYPILVILGLLLIWELAVRTELVPAYMLPSPSAVIKAFITDFPNLIEHSKITLTEAFLGLFFGVLLGFVAAVLMDSFEVLRKTIYPLIILTQTIPTVAIAPLLVLWLGYDMLPKIVLIVLTTFFPVAISLLDGFRSVDRDYITLLESMGASRLQIFKYLKFPGSLTQFFSALKIAVSYSIVGAVISEWLGGFSGLGVYMTRVKKSYAFDRMFAVIFLISAISLLLMSLVSVLRKRVIKWENIDEE